MMQTAAIRKFSSCQTVDLSQFWFLTLHSLLSSHQHQGYRLTTWQLYAHGLVKTLNNGISWFSKDVEQWYIISC